MTYDAGVRLFVLPSLKVTGGTLEVIRLARELADRGVAVSIVAMWRAQGEADCQGVRVIRLSETLIAPATIIAEVAAVTAAFRRLMRDCRPRGVAFTHYVTFPLSWTIRRDRRWFFVQDLEWQFVSAGIKRRALRTMILRTLRTGRTISANRYLSQKLRENAAVVTVEAPIWADGVFLNESAGDRDIDLVTVLRRGAHKRADLALAVIEAVRLRRPATRVTVISPDAHFRAMTPTGIDYVEAPSRTEMRANYGRARAFLLTSEHEGFALPPLEAMGGGCVPVCRDAGGVRNYMTGALEAELIPLNWDALAIADAVIALLNDPARCAALSAAGLAIFRAGLQARADRVDALMTAGF